MATVEFTPYYSDDPDATDRTNDYLVDGHGIAAPERTNRYILSHDLHTPSVGYNCPNDAKAATDVMEVLKDNYKRNNAHKAVVNGTSEKRDIEFVQWYFSLAEYEFAPAEEMLAMTAELIERTPLKDFACFYAYHKNTLHPLLQDGRKLPPNIKLKNPGNIHVHINTSPYSLDGTRKLCINNQLRYEIWREANRICVEHGYSLIDNSKLLADEEYRKWFKEVKEKGEVKIYSCKANKKTKDENGNPIKVEPETDSKKFGRGKEKEDYKGSLRRNAKAKEHLREEIQKRFDAEDPEMYHDDGRIYFPRYTENGLALNELSLKLLSYVYFMEDIQEQIPSANFRKDIEAVEDVRAYLESNDIKTRKELHEHKLLCGDDIRKLKQEIRRQDTILSSISPLLATIEEWESKHTPEAYHALKSKNASSEEQRKDVRRRYERALRRKADAERLLAERNEEYKDLSTCEYTVDRRPEKIENYVMKRTIGNEDLKNAVLDIAEQYGISVDDLRAAARSARNQESGTVVLIYRRRRSELDEIYKQLEKEYERLREARRETYRRYPVYGPITMLLAVLFHLSDTRRVEVEKSRIDRLKAEATVARLKAESMESRVLSAKRRLAIETLGAEDDELNAAFERFEKTLTEIRAEVEKGEPIEPGHRRLIDIISGAGKRTQRPDPRAKEETKEASHD